VKKINIICAGKLKEKYFVDAIAEYQKRLTRYCNLDIIQLPDYPDLADAVKREGKLMLAYTGKGYCIALDSRGKALTSEGLSQSIDHAYLSHSEISFFIGGSQGLCDTVKSATHLSLSFGLMTYPHQLMRVILAEQIYRAFCITNGTPYHK